MEEYLSRQRITLFVALIAAAIIIFIKGGDPTYLVMSTTLFIMYGVSNAGFGHYVLGVLFYTFTLGIVGPIIFILRKIFGNSTLVFPLMMTVISNIMWAIITYQSSQGVDAIFLLWVFQVVMFIAAVIGFKPSFRREEKVNIKPKEGEGNETNENETLNPDSGLF